MNVYLFIIETKTSNSKVDDLVEVFVEANNLKEATLKVISKNSQLKEVYGSLTKYTSIKGKDDLRTKGYSITYPNNKIELVITDNFNEVIESIGDTATEFSIISEQCIKLS